MPWTELILRDRHLPNDLNLQLSQRVSTALMFLLMAMAFFGVIYAGQSFVLTLLTLLFLFLVQFEVESTWKTNPKMIVATIVLVGAIVYLAYRQWNRWLIPPVLLTWVLMYLRHRYAFTTQRRRRITGALCGVYLLFVILFVLVYLPRHQLVFWFFLVLSVLVVLNSQFYVFLAGVPGDCWRWRPFRFTCCSTFTTASRSSSARRATSEDGFSARSENRSPCRRIDD